MESLLHKLDNKEEITDAEFKRLTPNQKRLLHQYLDALETEEEERKLQQARQRRRQRKRRSVWVREWIQRRDASGVMLHLIPELGAEDPNVYYNFMRLPKELVEEVTQRLAPKIEKKDTLWRRALKADLKVAITLRYLATGDSYHSLMYIVSLPCATQYHFRHCTRSLPSHHRRVRRRSHEPANNPGRVASSR